MSKTVEEVKADFRSKGQTIVSWAQNNGYPLSSVRAVLSGHNKGHFGQSHKIAVALGLKDGAK